MVLGKIRFVRKHPSIPNYQFLECPITLVANIDREFPFNVESFDVAGRSLGLLSRTIHVIVTCADNTTYRDEFSFELYEELLRISIEETKGDES